MWVHRSCHSILTSHDSPKTCETSYGWESFINFLLMSNPCPPSTSPLWHMAFHFPWHVDTAKLQLLHTNHSNLTDICHHFRITCGIIAHFHVIVNVTSSSPQAYGLPLTSIASLWHELIWIVGSDHTRWSTCYTCLVYLIISSVLIGIANSFSKMIYIVNIYTMDN